MAVTLTPARDRIVLGGISWHTYQNLVLDLESEPGKSLTYDRGTLEIMVPLDEHEEYKKILGRLVETTTRLMKIEVRGLGSRTWSREDLQRGLEPDECFYIQNEAVVRNKKIDLSVDPPPDLAIEIDITSMSLDRLAIYAALGVPEVWRFDGEVLKIYGLVGNEYRIRESSLALPLLSAEAIADILQQSKHLGQNALFDQVENWLRERM